MQQASWIVLLSAIVLVCSACTKQTDNMDENTQIQEEVIVQPLATVQPTTEPLSTTTDVESLELDLGDMKLETETFQ